MMLLPRSRFFGARRWLRPDVRTVQDVLLPRLPCVNEPVSLDLNAGRSTSATRAPPDFPVGNAANPKWCENVSL